MNVREIIINIFKIQDLYLILEQKKSVQAKSSYKVKISKQDFIEQ